MESARDNAPPAVRQPCGLRNGGQASGSARVPEDTIRRDLLPHVQKALADRYAVERELARGGAARVFLARDPSGQHVALKVMHPELAVTVTADRFLREIEYLRKMDNPRIAKLLDFGESDWLVYYVMSYVPGPTLREHLTRQQRCAVDETLQIALDLLEALEYAHGMGVVHRDVKPENVVLAEGGAVLMDFGIARAIAQSGEDRITRSGFAVGTSTYMSPEQIAGEKVIDHRSDFYSLGCVLYECITGRPPFWSKDENVVLTMHQEEPAPEVGSLRKDLPTSVRAAITRALEKDPAARWQSAWEMREKLSEG